MRASSPHLRATFPEAARKPPAKKQPFNEKMRPGDTYGDLPNADSGLSEDPLSLNSNANSTTASHRPALELIMYILLGLFILIALIFAVNCGAMVARYRWEHARGAKEAQRLQTLSELAMSNANTDVEGAAEYSSSSAAELNSQTDRIDSLVS